MLLCVYRRTKTTLCSDEDIFLQGSLLIDAIMKQESGAAPFERVHAKPKKIDLHALHAFTLFKSSQGFIKTCLSRENLVRFLEAADTIEKHGQVEVVVQLLQGTDPDQGVRLIHERNIVNETRSCRPGKKYLHFKNDCHLKSKVQHLPTIPVKGAPRESHNYSTKTNFREKSKFKSERLLRGERNFEGQPKELLRNKILL